MTASQVAHPRSVRLEVEEGGSLVEAAEDWGPGPVALVGSEAGPAGLPVHRRLAPSVAMGAQGALVGVVEDWVQGLTEALGPRAGSGAALVQMKQWDQPRM